MATPTSGAISISNINTEIGWAWNAYNDLNWVRNNTKDYQQNLNNVRGRVWFQLNGSPTVVVGNCSNSNTVNCIESYCNCSNCVGAQCRDSRAWLQPNCNCNCTGNCNCNCNCNCDCDCHDK